MAAKPLCSSRKTAVRGVRARVASWHACPAVVGVPACAFAVSSWHACPAARGVRVCLGRITAAAGAQALPSTAPVHPIQPPNSLHKAPVQPLYSPVRSPQTAFVQPWDSRHTAPVQPPYSLHTALMGAQNSPRAAPLQPITQPPYNMQTLKPHKRHYAAFTRPCRSQSTAKMESLNRI